MKKREFSERLVVNISAETQPPLGWMFGNANFGHLADIDHTMVDDIDVPQEIQAQKIPISMKNLTSLILLISFMS